MIKKTILMLLVLVGGVMSANAWNDLYLLCGENGSWSVTSYGENFKFVKTGDNSFRATVPGSYIHNGSWHFRFREKDSSWWNVGPKANNSSGNVDVTSSSTTTNYQNSSENSDGSGDGASFYVTKNENAHFIQIFLSFSNSEWTVSAKVITDNYTISFTNPDGWTTVKAYAHYHVDNCAEQRPLGDWSGSGMNQNGSLYTISVPAINGGKIIFTDGVSQYPSEGGFDIIPNGLYGSTGITGVSATLGAYGYTTFSSECQLDLDHIANATAYYVSEAPENSVKLIQATGTVAAGEGLVLYGNDATKTVTIPVAASGTAISGNMLVGCPTGTTLNNQTANYSNIYVLVNTNTRPEFQNVNTWITGGNIVTIPAGKAYLQALTANGAPSFSIEFDGETTSIANIERTIGDNQYYTLDGRRVALPTKGLYIVNGKKVIIK